VQKHRQRSTALLSLALSLGASAAACKHAEPPANDASSPDAQADADGGAEVPDAGPRPPQRGWWSDRVFYEIFVRSFADADGDGIGDFKGLTAKLDTLQDGNPATTTDLGVGGLWLMPIQASPSYHGYDVTDYRALNPQYGTMADFEAFIAAAHQRGLKVIIDYVLNHASLQHPYFAAADKRDWFVWRSDDPGWRQPWGSGAVWHARGGAYYYGVFWSGMPDWNLRNAAVEAEHLENLRFWLAKGVGSARWPGTGCARRRSWPRAPSGSRRERAAPRSVLWLVREARARGAWSARASTIARSRPPVRPRPPPRPRVRGPRRRRCPLPLRWPARWRQSGPPRRRRPAPRRAPAAPARLRLCARPASVDGPRRARFS
jgi:hypothetical protein